MEILIAEDDKATRAYLKKILIKWNYEVVEARNGSEAIEIMLSSDAPKLALIDWIMPEIDGIEVCGKIRERKTLEPPYLIFVTVMDKKKDIVKGLRAGANDYVTKPFDHTELQARIEVGCRVIKLQSELCNRLQDLEHALDHVKKLQGILPICMHCHKIRTDEESWERLEQYLLQHTEAKVSHGLCPECIEKHYPELDKRKKLRDNVSG